MTLTDGPFHTVDSSDMAFRQGGADRDARGYAEMQPVLLEPIIGVQIACPTDSTAPSTHRLPAGAARSSAPTPETEWEGWDEVHAYVPPAEIGPHRRIAIGHPRRRHLREPSSIIYRS